MVDPERLILTLEGDETLRDTLSTLVRDTRDRLGLPHKTAFVGGILELDEAVGEVISTGGRIDLAMFDLSNAPGSLPEEVVDRMKKFKDEMPDAKMIGYGVLPLGLTKDMIENETGATFLEVLDVEDLEHRIEDALK